MTPLEISCRHTDPDGTNCAAQAGEPCAWHGRAAVEPGADPYHAERIEDAAIMSRAGDPVSAEAFDQAAANKLFGG